MSGDADEEGGRYGSLVPVVFVPPDAAAGGAPAAGHVLKDGAGHVEIAVVLDEVVGFDPEEGPPAFIVVEVVDEGGPTVGVGVLGCGEGVVEDGGCEGNEVGEEGS